MKILTIIPSIYPEKLNKMLDSYYDTVSRSCLVITTAPGLTTAINEIFNKYPNFDMYHITNDDVEYLTKNWDIKLANKGKISHGNDAIEQGINGQFLMIDGDIARAVGWLQLPTLDRYCGDVVWRFIGDQLRIMNHVKDVDIKHHWEGCSNEIVNKEDMQRFAEWLPGSYRDIGKIKEILNDRTKKTI